MLGSRENALRQGARLLMGTNDQLTGPMVSRGWLEPGYWKQSTFTVAPASPSALMRWPE